MNIKHTNEKKIEHLETGQIWTLKIKNNIMISIKVSVTLAKYINSQSYKMTDAVEK